jgi:hypothetical protein
METPLILYARGSGLYRSVTLLEKAFFVHRVAVVTGVGHPRAGAWQGFRVYVLSPALIVREGKTFAAIGTPKRGPDSVPHAIFFDFNINIRDAIEATALSAV